MRRSVTFTVLVLVFCSTVWGAEAPVAVSPGSPTGSLIGDECPTFSWGAVDGAKFYELVVYRVEADMEEARPVLSERIAGSALSWTPSLDRCLERGGQYAWSVRAAGGGDASDWSPPSLFEVASGPNEAEFEEALQVVRQYLVTRGEVETEGITQARVEVEPQSSPEPRRLPPATTQLSVDGNVDATSFTGSGIGLTGVDAETLDGLNESAFFRLNQNEIVTGIPAFNGGDSGGPLFPSPPFTVDSLATVINLNADLLDGLHRQAFFTLSDDETVTGVPAFNGGTSGSTSPFTVDSTQVVINLNADFLNGLGQFSFFRLSQNETVTGRPAFNGGTTLTSPFTVDSTAQVENLNAEFLNGVKIQTGKESSPNVSLCPTTKPVVFVPSFDGEPVVVLAPEGKSGFAEPTVGNNYCVITGVTTQGFSHCCYGDLPRVIHWIATTAS